MAARPAPPPPRRKPHRLLEKADAGRPPLTPPKGRRAAGEAGPGQAKGGQRRSRQPPAPPAAGRGRRRSDVSADPPRRHLARRAALRGPPRPAPAAVPGMGLCGRAWARCGGPGVLWGLALGRGFPRPCRTGGWEPPRAEGTARYGLWAAAGGGVPAPRGVRGLRSSNPFTRRQEEEWRRRNRSALAYIAAAAVGMVGMSYAAVPLYRLYCQVRGRPAWLPAPSLPRRAAESGGEGPARVAHRLCFLSGHGPGRNDGRGPQLGADREHGAGEGPGHQGHFQRGRAFQHPVELQAPAERNLRE